MGGTRSDSSPQKRICSGGDKKTAESVSAADFSGMYNEFIQLGVIYVIATLFVMRRRVRLGRRTATF